MPMIKTHSIGFLKSFPVALGYYKPRGFTFPADSRRIDTDLPEPVVARGRRTLVRNINSAEEAQRRTLIIW